LDENTRQLSELFHQAAETYHQVFSITDGEDPDWTNWYSDWLVNLSKLPQLVGAKPVRSEVTYLLVLLDKQYVQAASSVKWEDFYADRLMLSLSARG
jgi:hypothetical protein